MNPVKTISIRYVVANSVLAESAGYAKSRAIDDLYRQCAEELHAGFISEKTDTHTTTYTLDAYVITPNDLEQLISDEIEKRKRNMPNVTFL